MVAIAIHSSFIKSAAYDEVRQVLRLEMGSSWYYYYGVTIQKVRRFQKAASKGRYFSQYIKGQYETLKRAIRK